MRRGTKLALALALLSSGLVFAALKKDTLVYVKARNTKVLEKPDGAAKAIATLQPGDEVKWQSGPENKEFHKVSADGKTGYVYFSSLSTKPPSFQPEYTKESGNTTVSPKAFASSGAATKALGPGAVEYGDDKLKQPEAVKRVETVEGISADVTPAEIAAHGKAAGIPAPMGEEAAR